MEMKISKVRVILILLMFLHGGVALHAETPTYTAKPLYSTSGSSVYSKSGKAGITSTGPSVGNLAVPMGGGISTTNGGSAVYGGGGFSSTSSMLNGGSRANLSFDKGGYDYSVTSHSGVSRRRVSEDDHPLDPAMEPIGEIPFMLMLVMLLGYLLATRKKLLKSK